MATVYDVEGNILIEEVAKKLSEKENLKAPEWSAFVKTGPSKDRVPARDDWWYVRGAAILRAIYRSKGPIGVQKLRIKYGSKKNRGHKPEKFFRASGKIIRLLLQQLEKEELIKQAEVGVHKGRAITPKGKSFLDKIASSLATNKPKKVVKEEKADKPAQEVKAEEKPAKEEKAEPVKEEKAEEKPAEKAKPVKEEKTQEVKADKPAEEVKEEKAPKKE